VRINCNIPRTAYAIPMLKQLRAVLGAAHFGPTVVVTLTTVALGVVSGLDAWRVAVLGCVILCNQLSVGWSNDAIDSGRDAEAERADKPIARGDVSARGILNSAIVAAALSIALSLLLGPAFAIAHLVGLAAGWAYNLGLKRTLAATACYLVFFGLLPLLVTLAREEPRPAAWWAMLMGGMLGLAAHFANVLPDLEADRRHGISSLPHRLGARPAGLVALLALAVVGVLGVLGVFGVLGVLGELGTAQDAAQSGAVTPVTIIGGCATLVLLAAGLVVIVRAPASRALFRIIMAAALAAVVTLAGAAGSIIA
jgi:4-hydroxybenzoate polyprenyltransferase